MNVQHFEKGLHYSDRDLIVLAKKLGRLATYCERLKDESSAIRVEAERRPTKKDKDQVKVMITVSLPGKKFRAESRRKSPIDAVDRCIEKLEAPLKKYKELHTGRGKAAKFATRRTPRKRRASAPAIAA
ncbi:MAG: HPF/RaiA family ribosome-associated protein [Candidatus Peribacteraceae bacterium]|jgi:ribosome-associated translation inhibitor RaiA